LCVPGWFSLEEGTFKFPAATGSHVEIRSDEFMMLLRGIDLETVKRRKRFSLVS
jgi:hypothetical protein